MKNIKVNSVYFLCLLTVLVICPAGVLGQIIIDHNCCDLGAVPTTWINAAKTNFNVWYGHTSHGNQITVGIDNLQSHYGSPYTHNPSGSGDALSYQEVGGDLGHTGDLGWEEDTRAQLDDPGNDRNVVMWSWCGGCSDNTEGGINTYLNAMNQLETDYPGVLFVYMTGHLDIWSYTNLKARNQQIRDYCMANGKTLFDFADIESYNPDGTYYDFAHDSCDYYDGPGGAVLGNWADEWCGAHSDSDLCWSCDCDHSKALNCNLKGRAFWWLMAEMAGWNHTPSTPTPPVPTPTQGPSNCLVSLYMPDTMFYTGSLCMCTVTVTNDTGGALTDHPLFVILDVYGSYFFAPSFSAYDNYLSDYPSFASGDTEVTVIPEFNWPNGAGSATDIIFYAAITDPGINGLYSNLDTWTFGWTE